MCGRLVTHSSPLRVQYLDALFPRSDHAQDEEPDQGWNVAPTENVLVQVHDAPLLRAMRWWLTPGWADSPKPQYSMFNARAESIATKPAFRGPFRHRRCVVPVTGYYEWLAAGGSKTPYLVEPTDTPMLLAGVWDVWERDGGHLESFAIITSEAAPPLAWLHERMPVMIPPDTVGQWLDPATDTKALAALLLPALPFQLQAFPVTSKMGNSRWKDPACVTPLGEPRYMG